MKITWPWEWKAKALWLRAQVQLYAEKLEALDEALCQAKKSAVNAAAVIAQQREMIGSLHNQVDNLTHQLNGSYKQCMDLSTLKLPKDDSEDSFLNTELDSARESIIDRQFEIAKLRSDLAAATQFSDQQKATIHSQDAQIADLHTVIAGLRREYHPMKFAEPLQQMRAGFALAVESMNQYIHNLEENVRLRDEELMIVEERLRRDGKVMRLKLTRKEDMLITARAMMQNQTRAEWISTVLKSVLQSTKVEH